MKKIVVFGILFLCLPVTLFGMISNARVKCGKCNKKYSHRLFGRHVKKCFKDVLRKQDSEWSQQEKYQFERTIENYENTQK